MQVHISIGENQRFELREALLVYGDRQRSFVTRHQVTLRKDAPPTLEPAQPLTLGFLESLARSLGGSSTAEVLPENVLAKGDRMIAWWTPACRRQMFYEDDGRVCIGTMRHPSHATAASMPDWERGFYESAFTHANVGRLTRHQGGFEGLWSGLAGKRSRFPLETLIRLPQTLAQFVGRERG
jgi:hypothetical protein